MSIHYLRVREVEWEAFVATAVTAGVVCYDEGSLLGQTWVYVGPIAKPTGNTVVVDGVEFPETALVVDAEGAPYRHVNLVVDQLPASLQPYEIATPANPHNVIFT